MKLKISKSKSYNPATEVSGFAATVKSNGTATFAELVEEAGHNTSMNPAEVEACAKLFVQAAVAQIKKGMIVDLGPLGKLYPACTSGWFANAAQITLDKVKTHVNYQPSADIKGAIASATLAWAKAEDDENEGEGEDDSPGTGGGSGGGDVQDMD